MNILNFGANNANIICITLVQDYGKGMDSKLPVDAAAMKLTLMSVNLTIRLLAGRSNYVFNITND